MNCNLQPGPVGPQDEDRIYGDGVNIAARIQTAAESDSVFVSQSLFDQVKRQSSYRFEDLGLHSLKQYF